MPRGEEREKRKERGKSCVREGDGRVGDDGRMEVGYVEWMEGWQDKRCIDGRMYG